MMNGEREKGRGKNAAGKIELQHDVSVRIEID